MLVISCIRIRKSKILGETGFCTVNLKSGKSLLLDLSVKLLSFWLLLIVLNYYIDAIQDDFEKEYSIVDLFEKKRIRIR